MTEPTTMTGRETARPCVFVPPHEPWTCSTHPAGYRTSLDETECSDARRDGTEPREGLPRALYLIQNFLWNEDGAEDSWIEEAHELVKVAVNDYDRLRAIEEQVGALIEHFENVGTVTGHSVAWELRSALAVKLREEG